MTDLDQALMSLATIRRQVARQTNFRGYGPATVAATGMLAMVSAAVQALWLPAPAKHMQGYLSLWLMTALFAVLLTGWEVRARIRRMHSGLADEMIQMAIEQMLPALIVGAMLTATVAIYIPTSTWMLPGLWQIVLALGILSSRRFLPKATVYAAAWFVLTGLSSLALNGERALSPWVMGMSFGVGQLLVAAILYQAHQVLPDED